jgi:hypothetical protein
MSSFVTTCLFTMAFRTRRISNVTNAGRSIAQQPTPNQNQRHPSGIAGPSTNLRIPNHPPTINI